MNSLRPILRVLLFPWFVVVAGVKFLIRSILQPTLVVLTLTFFPKPFNSILNSSHECIWRGSSIPADAAVHVAAHERALRESNNARCRLVFCIPACWMVTGVTFLIALLDVLALTLFGTAKELRCSSRRNLSMESKTTWLLVAEFLLRSLASASFVAALMTAALIRVFLPRFAGPFSFALMNLQEVKGNLSQLVCWSLGKHVNFLPFKSWWMNVWPISGFLQITTKFLYKKSGLLQFSTWWWLWHTTGPQVHCHCIPKVSKDLIERWLIYTGHSNCYMVEFASQCS